MAHRQFSRVDEPLTGEVLSDTASQSGASHARSSRSTASQGGAMPQFSFPLRFSWYFLLLLIALVPLALLLLLVLLPLVLLFALFRLLRRLR